MAHQVAYIQELLRLIARQTSDPKTLYNGCLVSHAFNAAFTPYLYKDIRFHSKNALCLIDRDRRRLILENIAKHATTLTIDIGKLAVIVEDEDGLCRPISVAVAEICQHSRHIRTFACEGTRLTTQCLGALSRLPHLESLSITFPEADDIDDTDDTEVTEAPQVPVDFDRVWEHLDFVNLRQLSLLRFDGNEVDWRRPLLQIILQSPRLKHLSLSMAQSRVIQDVELFRWVAEQYKRRRGHRLRLKTLRLGVSMMPRHNLHGLIDLDILDELSVYDSVFFLTNSPPHLAMISIQKYSARQPCWVAQTLIFDGLMDNLTDFKPVGMKATWLKIDELCRILKVTRILLPPGACDNIRYLDEVGEPLTALHRIVDLGLSMPAARTVGIAPTWCESFRPLSSVENLWIMGSHSESHAPVLAEQAASALPTLKFVKVGQWDWRIFRQGSYIGLDELCEWDAYRPRFFYNWQTK